MLFLAVDFFWNGFDECFAMFSLFEVGPWKISMQFQGEKADENSRTQTMDRLRCKQVWSFPF